jgi:hypothetical protein
MSIMLLMLLKIESESKENKIFATGLLPIKILYLSLQPILEKNQRDINKAVKVIKNKVKCLQFSN